MQYIGTEYEGTVYVFATDAPQVFLGDGAQSAASWADLLAKFPGTGGVEFPPEFIPMPWDAEVDYRPGNLVRHVGRYWQALDDVATGAQPDDVYAEDGSSGGWMPLLT